MLLRPNGAEWPLRLPAVRDTSNVCKSGVVGSLGGWCFGRVRYPRWYSNASRSH
jgi:hypothetical protein